MRQSTIIFGTILLSFIVYITTRSQLTAYLDLFRSKGSGGGTYQPNGATPQGGIGGTVTGSVGLGVGAKLLDVPYFSGGT